MMVRKICIASMVWMLLMTLVVFIPDISPWIATPVVIVGVVFVIGILLAINFRVSTEKLSELIAYSGGLGLAYAMVGVLGMNWLLPHLGVYQPLAKLPLVLFFDISALVLCWCAYYFNRGYFFAFKFRSPDVQSLFFGAIPVGFVILSAVGSYVLNNSGGGSLTLLMLIGIASYVLILIVCRKSVQGWVYISALYSISLSLLLMYSLRSTHILGWDINLEYQVFQTTLQNLVWSMSSHIGLDYNACTSITILPTIFRVLTGISSEYVFKFTFQLLFATTPVLVYILARRYLEEGMAFLAAFLFLSQTWFFEQMPALIRQEVAFIFCILGVLVLFDKQISARVRYILFSIFTAAIVLSHYSTAYVWIALLLGVVVITYVLNIFWKPIREVSKTFGLFMMGISVALLLVWQFPMTHTLGKVTKFVTNDNGQATSTPAMVAVKIIDDPKVEKLSDIELAAIERNGNDLGDRYSSDTTSGYMVELIDDRVFVGGDEQSDASATIGFLAKIFKLLLIGGLPLIGIVGMFFEVHRRRLEDYEMKDLLIFSVASYALIMLMLMLPYLQEYYNFTRLYLQMFLVLSVTSMIGAGMVLKYLPRFRTSILALILVIAFLSSSGAIDQITGGQTRITLNQPPSTQDTFYIYDSEIAGAKWLAEHRNMAYPVQADIIANLRLQSFGGMSADNFDIFPSTLKRDSYVYLIRTNLYEGKAHVQYKNEQFVYNYPLEFLKDNKDLIYSSGGSRIYK